MILDNIINHPMEIVRGQSKLLLILLVICCNIEALLYSSYKQLL